MSKVPYYSAVDSLMYAMVCTCPDISHAVNVMNRYMAKPRKLHWQAVKWILWYLRALLTFVWSLGKTRKVQLATQTLTTREI